MQKKNRPPTGNINHEVKSISCLTHKYFLPYESLTIVSKGTIVEDTVFHPPPWQVFQVTHLFCHLVALRLLEPHSNSQAVHCRKCNYTTDQSSEKNDNTRCIHFPWGIKVLDFSQKYCMLVLSESVWNLIFHIRADYIKILSQKKKITKILEELHRSSPLVAGTMCTKFGNVDSLHIEKEKKPTQMHTSTRPPTATQTTC